MRVCLFAHRAAEAQPTGIGRYLRELALALAEVAGDDDSLVLASTREPGEAEWVSGRIEARALPWPRRAVQAAWCLGAGPHLERSLGHLGAVHLMQPFPPVPARAAQVVTIHDVFPFEHPEWYPRSEPWVYRRCIALVRRRANRLIVPSAYVGGRVESVLGVDPERIEVVPEGVSGTFVDSGAGADSEAVCARFGVTPRRFAVCIGAISIRKNQLALVRAAPQLADDGFALVMVGADGHGAETVSAELGRDEYRSRVVRAGYLSEPDMAALVRAAAAVVHPALAEGFGLVPLEAMAAGTPVIAARSGSIPEVVGDAAVLVDEPRDPSAWATALVEVAGSADLRRRLIAAGKRQATSFSWQRSARRMLEIYREAARAA
jgi:glycosyltransferase involved in cell wall biosynthesis